MVDQISKGLHCYSNGPRFVPGCNMKPLMKDKLGNTECKMLVANTIG